VVSGTNVDGGGRLYSKIVRESKVMGEVRCTLLRVGGTGFLGNICLWHPSTGGSVIRDNIRLTLIGHFKLKL
jgi:hypothetical protein